MTQTIQWDNENSKRMHRAKRSAGKSTYMRVSNAWVGFGFTSDLKVSDIGWRLNDENLLKELKFSLNPGVPNLFKNVIKKTQNKLHFYLYYHIQSPYITEITRWLLQPDPSCFKHGYRPYKPLSSSKTVVTFCCLNTFPLVGDLCGR